MSTPDGFPEFLATRRGQLRSQRGMTLVEVLIALSISVMLIAPLFSWAIVSLGHQRATVERNGETAGLAFLTTRLEEDAANAVEVKPPETPHAQLCASATGETVHLVLLRPDPGQPGEERQVVYSTADGDDPGPRVLRRHECAANGTDARGADLVEGLNSVTASCPPTADAGRRPPCWTVKLVIRPARGAVTAIEATRRIDSNDALPRARFVHDPLEVYRGEPVRFDAEGSWDPANQSLTYAWDFGDGTVVGPPDDDLVEVPHIFSAAGGYTVTLTVTNEDDHVGTASRQVVVRPARPKINDLNVTPKPTLRNRNLTFTATVDRGDSPTVTCTWHWGDGETTEPAACNGNVSATHRFGEPPDGRDEALKPRRVELVVSGDTVTATSHLVLDIDNLKPTVSVDLAPPSATRRGDDVKPTFRASSGVGSIWKIDVDWGDGKTDTIDCHLVTPCNESSLSHQYTARGDYTVTAIAYDDLGEASEPAEHVVHVKAKAPSGDFSPGHPNLNTPTPVSGTDPLAPVPVDDAVDVASWSWTLTSWPDQVSVRTSNVRTPSWNGVTPGKYQVTLVVTGHDDLPKTVTKYVKLTGTPGAPANVRREDSGAGGGGNPPWVEIGFDAVPGATAYQVDLNRRGPCADPNRVWNAAGVADGGRYELRLQAPGLCLGQDYRVRVRAAVDGVWGNWTTIRVPL